MYIDYSKVKARRSLGKSKPGVVISPDNIDWAAGAGIYQAAADAAEELHIKAHKDAHLRAYKHKIQKLEEEYQLMNPESGSYEGNFEDEYPMTPFKEPSDTNLVRRAAGSREYSERFLEPIGPSVFAALPKIRDSLGSMHVTRNSDGKVSALQFCKDHFNTPERMGLHRLLTLEAKGAFLDKQYLGDARYFSKLVPIVLDAQRIAKGIKYSEWEESELHFVMPFELANAMRWKGPVPSNEELLRDRQTCLTFASGVSAGKVRSPLSTHKLYNTTGTVYEDMPYLVQVMLSQIWCAHPENRLKNMVLDPINWDSVPLPLVSTDVIATPTTTYESSTTLTSWD